MLFTATLPSRPAHPLLRALLAVLGMAMLALLVIFGFVALIVLLGVGAAALLVNAFKRHHGARQAGGGSVIEGEFVVLDDPSRKADRSPTH